MRRTEKNEALCSAHSLSLHSIELKVKESPTPLHGRLPKYSIQSKWADTFLKWDRQSRPSLLFAAHPMCQIWLTYSVQGPSNRCQFTLADCNICAQGEAKSQKLFPSLNSPLCSPCSTLHIHCKYDASAAGPSRCEIGRRRRRRRCGRNKTVG